jgi:hypothetical protein
VIVIDPQTEAILQGIMRRESRSLASYIADAYPWTKAAASPALDAVQQAIRNEAEAVSALGRYLVRHRAAVPFLGSYPAGFTSMNFVALDYLVPRLLASQRQLIAAVEADLRRLPTGGPREQAEALLAVKRQTLAALENLSSPVVA